jgi:hypothetical protein
MTPFEIADAARSSKKYIEDCDLPKSMFVVNRALSYNRDSLSYAQIMNLNPNLEIRLQFDFFFYGIRKNLNKNKSKWGKKDKNDTIDLIMEYYGYSYLKAIEASKNLNKEQLSYIKQKLYRGE